MTAPNSEHQISLSVRSMEVEKIIDPKKKVINQAYKAAKYRFLRSLALERRADLMNGGLSSPQIARMQRGLGPVPRGKVWAVHHVIPRRISARMADANASENLCLLRRSTHRKMHDYIDPQIEGMKPGQTRTIKFPQPNSPFYPVTLKQMKKQLSTAKQEDDRKTSSTRRFPSIAASAAGSWKAALPRLLLFETKQL